MGHVAHSPSSWIIAFLVYINYAILISLGHIKEALSRLFFPVTTKAGYRPLLKDFDDFYTRHLYTRIKDCWQRPISSRPSSWIDVMEVVSHDFNHTQVINGNTIHCLNLSSYNYLGFADSPDLVKEAVRKSLWENGISYSSVRSEYGTTPIHQELEEKIAKFVGKEAALVCAMGFATNSMIIPSLCGKGTLIISDSENHASIAVGSRSSGVKVSVFKHNDMKSLEQILRDSIAYGQPKTHRSWKKIIIIVEGIYSMEGETCKLKEIVALKKKYKAYLYVDEAHSIGALGKNGRGICDFSGVSPDDVDILMGTFTKSFGSIGGYVASSFEIIGHLKHFGFPQLYGHSMSVPCVQQIICALDTIANSPIGKEKLQQLHENSLFMRQTLVDMGFEVIGEVGSPVMCIMIYYPAMMPAFSRECLKRGVAVVVVGSPATDLIGSRCRICMSSALTNEDLKFGLSVIDEVGDICNLKYLKSGVAFIATK